MPENLALFEIDRVLQLERRVIISMKVDIMMSRHVPMPSVGTHCRHRSLVPTLGVGTHYRQRSASA
jgi:hypothetical protein